MSHLMDKSARFAGLIPPAMRSLTQRLRGGAALSGAETAKPAAAALSHQDMQALVQIPVHMTTPEQEAADSTRDSGLFLARQDRWDELAKAIRDHDRTRMATAGGTPLAELMAYGARADVVGAAEHALLHGRPAPDCDFISGIEAMETVLMERPGCYATALIVAHMHIDIGWAWRGTAGNESMSDLNREAFEAHFARAAEILAEHCPDETRSAALLAARCALLPGREDPGFRLIREFESLFAADPHNPRHMRSLGNYLLPRWYGDFDRLDLEARRAAATFQEVWGNGAYAWVWFDALLVDPDGFDHVEAEYFLDGLGDILARRPDQYTANLLAAHLYKSWQITRDRHRANGRHPDLAPRLRTGFETLVRDHLRELHPLVWGHAEIGFENTARLISPQRLARKGHQTGLAAVAMPFLKSLQDGHAVQFSPDGISQIRL